MKTRLAIAILWLGALVAALILVECYFWLLDAEGYPHLLPDMRSEIYPPVIKIYSVTIAPLLAALYFRPFKPPASAPTGKALAYLAVALTAGYNLLLLYLLGQGLWRDSLPLETIIAQAQQAALLLGFLVVPVNAYYFGLKLPADAGG